jgi:hypothetical protein
VLSSLPPQSLIIHSNSSNDKTPQISLASSKLKANGPNQRLSQGPYLIGGSNHLVSSASPQKFTHASYQRQSVFDAYYKLEDGKPVGGNNLAMSTKKLSTESNVSSRVMA